MGGRTVRQSERSAEGGAVGEAFIDAMLTDFELHGSVTIVKVREDNPAQYLKVIASLLPRDVHVHHDPLAEVSDDDLETMVALLRGRLE